MSRRLQQGRVMGALRRAFGMWVLLYGHSVPLTKDAVDKTQEGGLV